MSRVSGPTIGRNLTFRSRGSDAHSTLARFLTGATVDMIVLGPVQQDCCGYHKFGPSCLSIMVNFLSVPPHSRGADCAGPSNSPKRSCRPSRPCVTSETTKRLSVHKGYSMSGLAAAAALLLAAAGCGSHHGSANNGPAIAWAERVCLSVQRGATTLSQPPSIESTDPATARAGLVGYLDRVTGALDTVSRGITDAGPPPVSGGASAVAKATATLTPTPAAVGDAKTKL